VNFTEARNNLERALDEAIEGADYTVTNHRDAADAVVMPMGSFY